MNTTRYLVSFGIVSPILVLSAGASVVQPDEDGGRFMPAEKYASQPATQPAAQPATMPAAPASAAQFDELARMMTGAFSSEEQAVKDSDFFDIRLQIVPIWKPLNTRGDSAVQWFYVEQAGATSLEKPYRQRVYKLTMSFAPPPPDGVPYRVFRSEVYTLPGEKPDDALRFAGWWKTPEKFDEIKPADLKIKDGCAVLLTRNEKGEFDGGTVGEKCPSERSGAKYATSEVHIDAAGMKTWDRGFDEGGKQVWGAVKGGYVFRKVVSKEK